MLADKTTPVTTTKYHVEISRSSGIAYLYYLVGKKKKYVTELSLCDIVTQDQVFDALCKKRETARKIRNEKKQNFKDHLRKDTKNQ